MTITDERPTTDPYHTEAAELALLDSLVFVHGPKEAVELAQDYPGIELSWDALNTVASPFDGSVERLFVASHSAGSLTCGPNFAYGRAIINPEQLGEFYPVPDYDRVVLAPTCHGILITVLEEDFPNGDGIDWEFDRYLTEAERGDWYATKYDPDDFHSVSVAFKVGDRVRLVNDSGWGDNPHGRIGRELGIELTVVNGGDPIVEVQADDRTWTYFALARDLERV